MGPNLDKFVEKLGYALVPEYLPNGFQASNARMSGDRGVIVFGDPDEKLLVAYPVSFSQEDSPLMKELGLTRPNDAVSRVEVGGRPAYLLRGGWSVETIMQGPGIDPDDAEWDYDVSLTLFFDQLLPEGESIGVAVQALSKPSQWIADSEMIKIAESLRPSN